MAVQWSGVGAGWRGVLVPSPLVRTQCRGAAEVRWRPMTPPAVPPKPVHLLHPPKLTTCCASPTCTAEYGVGGGSSDGGNAPATSPANVAAQPYWGVTGACCDRCKLMHIAQRQSQDNLFQGHPSLLIFKCIQLKAFSGVMTVMTSFLPLVGSPFFAMPASLPHTCVTTLCGPLNRGF